MLEVDRILDRVSGLADELRLANLQPQITACGQQLGAPERIDVAGFGRSKAGKSSFLNHLAGRAMLPIGVVPLTAVIITRLRFGPAERAMRRHRLKKLWARLKELRAMKDLSRDDLLKKLGAAQAAVGRVASLGEV